MKKLIAALSLFLPLGCAQAPQKPSPEARTQLAPTGVLRVAVLTSNPLIGSKDPKTGELAPSE